MRKECTDWSITGGGPSRPPQVVSALNSWHPAGFAIAASVGRVAVVPAAVIDQLRGRWGGANGPVDVYNLSGRLLARVVPQGTVRQVAPPARPGGHRDPVGRNDRDRARGRRSGKLVTATTMPGASNLAISTGGSSSG
jgi:hypothetical protein